MQLSSLLALLVSRIGHFLVKGNQLIHFLIIGKDKAALDASKKRECYPISVIRDSQIFRLKWSLDTAIFPVQSAAGATDPTSSIELAILNSGRRGGAIHCVSYRHITSICSRLILRRPFADLSTSQ